MHSQMMIDIIESVVPPISIKNEMRHSISFRNMNAKMAKNAQAQSEAIAVGTATIAKLGALTAAHDSMSPMTATAAAAAARITERMGISFFIITIIA